MNIVALVGASCTGKTTLFEQLRKHYSQDKAVIFVEEAARQFFASNNHLDLETRFSKASQKEIQALARHLLNEAMSKNPQLIICDRTVMDPIVFTRINTKDSGDDMYDDVQDLVGRYNKIFLLSPDGIPFVNDNERHEGEEMRQRLHEGFIEFFSQHKIRYELVTGSRRDREVYVENQIKQLMGVS